MRYEGSFLEAGLAEIDLFWMGLRKLTWLILIYSSRTSIYYTFTHSLLSRTLHLLSLYHPFTIHALSYLVSMYYGRDVQAGGMEKGWLVDGRPVLSFGF